MKLSRMMHKQPHTVSALVHRMEDSGSSDDKTRHEEKELAQSIADQEG